MAMSQRLERLRELFQHVPQAPATYVQHDAPDHRVGAAAGLLGRKGSVRNCLAGFRAPRAIFRGQECLSWPSN